MIEKHMIVTDLQGAQWRLRRLDDDGAWANGIEIHCLSGATAGVLMLIPDECVDDFKKALESLMEGV